ncbi:hypothetical protein FB451DRAFT_1553688 [Mycena latifolia]|nr:hypothetical protein FB451DRAFT_1553688 [Mycena latifolia]
MTHGMHPLHFQLFVKRPFASDAEQRYVDLCGLPIIEVPATYFAASSAPLSWGLENLWGRIVRHAATQAQLAQCAAALQQALDVPPLRLFAVLLVLYPGPLSSPVLVISRFYCVVSDLLRTHAPVRGPSLPPLPAFLPPPRAPSFPAPTRCVSSSCRSSSPLLRFHTAFILLTVALPSIHPSNLCRVRLVDLPSSFARRPSFLCRSPAFLFASSPLLVPRASQPTSLGSTRFPPFASAFAFVSAVRTGLATNSAMGTLRKDAAARHAEKTRTASRGLCARILPPQDLRMSCTVLSASPLILHNPDTTWLRTTWCTRASRAASAFLYDAAPDDVVPHRLCCATCPCVDATACPARGGAVIDRTPPGGVRPTSRLATATGTRFHWLASPSLDDVVLPSARPRPSAGRRILTALRLGNDVAPPFLGLILADHPLVASNVETARQAPLRCKTMTCTPLRPLAPSPVFAATRLRPRRHSVPITGRLLLGLRGAYKPWCRRGPRLSRGCQRLELGRMTWHRLSLDLILADHPLVASGARLALCTEPAALHRRASSSVFAAAPRSSSSRPHVDVACSSIQRPRRGELRVRLILCALRRAFVFDDFSASSGGWVAACGREDYILAGEINAQPVLPVFPSSTSVSWGRRTFSSSSSPSVAHHLRVLSRRGSSPAHDPHTGADGGPPPCTRRPPSCTVGGPWHLAEKTGARGVGVLRGGMGAGTGMTRMVWRLEARGRPVKRREVGERIGRVCSLRHYTPLPLYPPVSCRRRTSPAAALSPATSALIAAASVSPVPATSLVPAVRAGARSPVRGSGWLPDLRFLVCPSVSSLPLHRSLRRSCTSCHLARRVLRTWPFIQLIRDPLLPASSDGRVRRRSDSHTCDLVHTASASYGRGDWEDDLHFGSLRSLRAEKRGFISPPSPKIEDGEQEQELRVHEGARRCFGCERRRMHVIALLGLGSRIRMAHPPGVQPEAEFPYFAEGLHFASSPPHRRLLNTTFTASSSIL